jgi:hypothetical protein
MWMEEVSTANPRMKIGRPTLARRLRLGPLRKDILNGSGSSEDLKEDCGGGMDGGCGGEKEVAGVGSLGKRSGGKLSIKRPAGSRGRGVE